MRKSILGIILLFICWNVEVSNAESEYVFVQQVVPVDSKEYLLYDWGTEVDFYIMIGNMFLLATPLMWSAAGW